MRAGLLAAAALAALAVACGSDDDAPPELGSPVATQSALALRLGAGDGMVLQWQDVEGETAYALSGAVVYSIDCEFVDDVESPSEEMTFEAERPADTTEYPLPTPSDGRFRFLSLVEAELEAVGLDGLADALGFSADPACE